MSPAARARVLLFDIEATDLEASFGHLLCIGYKYLGEKTTHVATLSQYPPANCRPRTEPDEGLCCFFHGLLTDRADILVSWYGKEYDRKFLNTRMLLAGCRPLPPLSSEHVDLYYTARGQLKVHSNRLQAVSETLGCPTSKTAVRADIWRYAQRGDRRAMAYVVDHCRKDVEVLEWIYLKVRGMVRQHPPVSPDRAACPVCGGTALESRGRRFRRGAVEQRYQCRGCGHWGYRRSGAR